MILATSSARRFVARWTPRKLLAWMHDTLARRLFLLMWFALIASHMAGYLTVHAIFADEAPGDTFAGLRPFPALPPTPGVPNKGIDLPLHVLAIDYGVRIAIIALAAWWGSRWLARPMRKLIAASQSLGSSVTGGSEPATLDDRQGTREVREAAQIFNSMSRRLHGQFRARDLMVAAMSHDLRTPLTRLRMRLDAMEEDRSATLRERSVNDIREMDQMIDTVLGVFRSDGIGVPEALRETAVLALVQSLTDDLIEQGLAASMATHALPRGADLALAEPASLRRVVGNLIENAVRYAGSAELSVEPGARHVLIVIEDRGPGIPPEHLETVFEPFFRVESSRNRHTGGTGLGLYIARELALRQGASLTLSNRHGGGLRAEVQLARP